jgi:predicted aspartyl protease
MASLKTFLEQKNYLKIPLILTGTNHLEVCASINGVSGRFILDTGASNTCVGFDKITFFKLNSEASEIKAAGAGATNMATLLSTRNTLTIGTWSVRKMQIVLFDLGHVNEALLAHNAQPVDGIIGADILRKSTAVIDYQKCWLYVRKSH